MKKILITGASGFIGGHLVESLILNGYKVRCFVRQTSDINLLKNLPVEIYFGDVLDRDSLKKAVKDIDYVIHLAGAIKAKDNKTYWLVNYQGTKNILEVILEENIKIEKFVFVSSQAAAGANKDSKFFREEDQPNPISHYGRSKLKAEDLVKRINKKFPTIILRPSLIYGPRDKETLIYFRLFKFGFKANLNRHFSACYIEDFVRACLLSLEKNVPSGSVYFISDGYSYSLKEINHYLKLLLKPKIIIPIPFISKILYLLVPILKIISKKPSIINSDRLREIAAKSWTCDISKAKKELGYQPKIFLKDGLEKTISWYKKYGWL